MAKHSSTQTRNLRASTEFGAFLAERYDSDEKKLAVERDVQRLMAYAELVRALDEQREAAGISKTELASRMGVSREVVSRLFSGSSGNPQLGTIVSAVMALGVSLDVRIKPADEAEPRALTVSSA